MPDDTFYVAPALSGSGFDALLASFASFAPTIKPLPPKIDTAFHWRSDVVMGPGISVLRTRVSGDWSYSCEAVQADLAIGFLGAGASDMVVGTRPVQRTTSTVTLVALPMLQHHKIRTSADGNHSNVILKFDAGIVAKMLSAMFGNAALTNLDLAPTVALSTGTGQTLHQLARTIVLGMHDPQILKHSSKAMALLTEATLRLVFENVPHSLSGRLDRRTPDVTPRHVRQAIEHMRANLHLPLTMVDVAVAVGVSERSLQLGFRRFHDTTPAAFLRRIRLEAVHAELSSPENELPVYEVALKWGFTHMGRFAAQYRAVFGAYPSETVKRAFPDD
ncbi:helix-turn-helix domain-containing protein [Bradyrhizobium sp. UFLA05-112]